MSEPLRIANIAAETGATPDIPAVRAVAQLWRSLFDEPPAFPWLPAGPEAAVAWLNTEAAVAEAMQAGRVLSGPSPEIVARVHDKVFAHEVARREGLLPRCLDGVIAAISPEELRADDSIALLQRRVAAWPAWAQSSFTLKPRWGSSGRGRVAGRDGNVETPEIRGALERLARCGGAMLEPWLERRGEVSVNFWIEPGAALRLVGSTDQLTDPSGLYRGARGTVDSRGRVAARSRHDEAAREIALPLANAAAELGFHGPFGADIIAFDTPDGAIALRAVETNARYTVGCIAVGLVRRQLPRLREELGLSPGGLIDFALLVSGVGSHGDAPLTLELAPEMGTRGPALYFSTEPAQIDALPISGASPKA
jgi:hypothetical protein